MKVEAVSALRSKRGLRPAEQVAEPQVVGLAPQTTMMTERTDTMKTYLLRAANPVETQKAAVEARPSATRLTQAGSGQNHEPTAFRHHD